MKPSILVSVLLTTLLAQLASAEDAYFHLPLTALNLTEGNLPARTSEPVRYRPWQAWAALQPYAALDGDGEVFIDGESFAWTSPNQSLQNQTVAIRAPKDKDVTGQVFVPKADGLGMVALKFKVEAAKATPESRQEFFRIKENHYRKLLERNIPGGAWFRHQQREAAKAHAATPAEPANPNGFNRARPMELENTYDLFTGGRAISENLQLDRLLRPVRAGEATVPITNLAGITVREMDWKSLVKDLKPQSDALASCIPFDQHAIFFPTFSAMTEMLDQADTDGTPILQLLEPRSEDANARGKYQNQLCLELNDISRLLGPRIITSVASTGSDPYLRTGTDVAMLFETQSTGVLQAFITARQRAVGETNSAVKLISGEFEGVPYAGAVSADRAVSSYIAALDNVVVVCNSRHQLENLIGAAKGRKPALAAQEEYIYFRSRYPRADKDETAFLILTDATIRRWCSPRWRIGNSRRTQAAAALAELQAAHLSELISGDLKEGVLEEEAARLVPGEVRLTRRGILSSTYGTLDFLTPIAELPLDKVTPAEADAYNRWRNSYQQNWNQFFDPIALRFSLGRRQWSAELAVMPLIAGSDYRQFIALTSGARIAPGAGDPHPEALLHLAFSINTESEMLKQAENFLGSMNPSPRVNPLGWLGQSVALYGDQDAFWDKLAKSEDSRQFLQKNYPQLPVALQFEVKNPLGLAAFLTALRGFVEQTAPKMTVWQSAEYHGQAYVKITPSAESAAQSPNAEMAKLAIFYAVTPKALVLTLSEPLLKRALDRQSAREPASGDAKSTTASLKPWLGTNLCLQVAAPFVAALERLSHDEYQSAQQLLAWNNLPILNEWKRLYPAQDPVKLHEQFWQTKLLCPGGGTYVWNEKWHTMESTVYGHPGEPKKGPGKFQPLARIAGANLGVSFENQGLSAKAVLERQPEEH